MDGEERWEKKVAAIFFKRHLKVNNFFVVFSSIFSLFVEQRGSARSDR